MQIPVRTESDGLQTDAAFESRLRSRERAVLTPLIASARAWYATQNMSTPSALRSVSRSLSTQTDADGALWFRLVNSKDSGAVNLQSLAGGNLASFVRDWSVSHAVDDVAAPSTQYQQRSWNWHNIYQNVGMGGNAYPLEVQVISPTTSISGSAVAGGAGFYKLTIAANASVTVTLSTPAGALSSNLQLIVVRTK